MEETNDLRIALRGSNWTSKVWNSQVTSWRRKYSLKDPLQHSLHWQYGRFPFQPIYQESLGLGTVILLVAYCVGIHRGLAMVPCTATMDRKVLKIIWSSFISIDLTKSVWVWKLSYRCLTSPYCALEAHRPASTLPLTLFSAIDMMTHWSKSPLLKIDEGICPYQTHLLHDSQISKTSSYTNFPVNQNKLLSWSANEHYNSFFYQIRIPCPEIF